MPRWAFCAARPEPEVTIAWRELVRVAPPRWRAPVATVYALWCFAAGSGARSNIAVDVALDADPDYAMAQLLAEAQCGGINPFEFIAAVAEGASWWGAASSTNGRRGANHV